MPWKKKKDEELHCMEGLNKEGGSLVCEGGVIFNSPGLVSLGIRTLCVCLFRGFVFLFKSRREEKKQEEG